MIPHDRIRLTGRLLPRFPPVLRWRKASWRVLVILYAILIFAVSSCPLRPDRPILPIAHGDKVLHAVEFSLFFVLSWKALSGRRRIAFALVLTALYAATDEVHQLFVATRTASLTDWLADLGGAGAAALLVHGVLRSVLLARRGVRILPNDARKGR